MKQRTRSAVSGVLWVAMVSACGWPGRTSAASGTWTNTADGTREFWTNSANWSASPYPGGGDSGNLTNSTAGTYTSVVDTDVIGVSTVRLYNAGAGTAWLTITNGATLLASNFLFSATGSKGGIRLDGGTLITRGAMQTGNGVIPSVAGNTNQVTTSSGNGTWNLSGGNLTVGTGGANEYLNQLALSGVVVTNVGAVSIGVPPSGTGVFVLSNTLVVASGAKLFSTADSAIAWGGTANGTRTSNSVTVAGSGSLWDLGGANLQIGNPTLGVTNNAVLVLNGGTLRNGQLMLNTTSSWAALNGLAFDASSSVNLGITVGSAVAGVTNILDPTVTARTPTNQVVWPAGVTGWNAGGGSLTIGSGSGANDDYVGLSGAAFSNFGSVILGSLASRNALVITGQTASLSVNSGGIVVGQTTVSLALSNNLVQALNARVVNAGPLFVGWANPTATLLDSQLYNNRVTVSGGSWTNLGAVVVGRAVGNGAGHADVADGNGLIASNQTALYFGGGIIVGTNNSGGSVTSTRYNRLEATDALVSGAGSMAVGVTGGNSAGGASGNTGLVNVVAWDGQGGSVVVGLCGSGSADTNTLELFNGVITNFASVLVGSQANQNSLIITGQTARFSVNSGGSIIVGQTTGNTPGQSNDLMQVFDAGIVNAGALFVGFANPAAASIRSTNFNNRLTVSGGSWTNLGPVVIGCALGNGTGYINESDSNSLMASGNATLYFSGGLLIGTNNLGGSCTRYNRLEATNATVIGAGSVIIGGTGNSSGGTSSGNTGLVSVGTWDGQGGSIAVGQRLTGSVASNYLMLAAGVLSNFSAVTIGTLGYVGNTLEMDGTTVLAATNVLVNATNTLALNGGRLRVLGSIVNNAAGPWVIGDGTQAAVLELETGTATNKFMGGLTLANNAYLAGTGIVGTNLVLNDGAGIECAVSGGVPGRVQVRGSITALGSTKLRFVIPPGQTMSRGLYTNLTCTVGSVPAGWSVTAPNGYTAVATPQGSNLVLNIGVRQGTSMYVR